MNVIAELKGLTFASNFWSYFCNLTSEICNRDLRLRSPL